MNGRSLERIGVLGCGLMGAGIAEICARSGLDVVVLEVDDAAAARGRDKVESSLAKAASRGKLTPEQLESATRALTFTADWDAFADRDLVIEAIAENPTIKDDAFRRLDAVLVGEHAVLASNTSSIPIAKLARATSRPENVVGLHFFNPVLVLPLVELVPSLMTSDATADAVAEFASSKLGKHVIRSKDRSGFVVNALLVPYLLSAIRMFESGFASAEDIDTGMMHGCAHPMGPLALSDMIGLDTILAVAESLYGEFKEPLFAPPPLLRRLCDAGHLGKKTGRGIYEYLP